MSRETKGGDFVNPFQRLIEIGKLIERANPQPDMHYQICINKGEVACLPVSKSARPEIVFFVCSGNVLREGLTSQQWSLLERKLVYYFEGEKKCPEQSKL